MKQNMFSKVINRMMSNFIPQEDDEARLSFDGKVVVKTNTPNGKEFVDKDNNVYPEEMLSDFPVFTVASPVDKVKKGDIVKLTKSTFAVVESIKEGIIETISFGGQHRQAKAFKDAFMKQATVRVVINPLSGVNDQNNTLMMLSLLDRDADSKSDFVTTMMLSSMLTGAGQNPFGTLFNNPMAMAMLVKGDSSAIQNIMMMQAMQGGLGNIFQLEDTKKD